MADVTVNEHELLERYLDAHQRHMDDVSRYIKMGRGVGLGALLQITAEVVERWKELAREEEEALRRWHEVLSRYTSEDA